MQFANPALRQVVIERHVAQTEVIGLLDIEIGGAAPVGVAIIGVVGEITGVLRTGIAGILPAVVDIGGDRRIALPDRILDHTGLHVVVDRVSDRIVQIDRQREPLVAERIADASRRVGHDTAQIEHILGIDNFVAVGVAGRTGTVAPLVVAGILASRNLRAVAYAMAFRQCVVISGIGLRLRLDDMIDLVAVDAAERLADGRAAEAVSRFGHLVTADPISLFTGGISILVDFVVGILLRQRQHLVAVVGVGQTEIPREILGADHLRIQLGLEAVEASAAHVGLHVRVGAGIGHGDREEHVVGLLVVIVEDKPHAVVQKSHIQPHVELCGRLPLHVGVLHGRGEDGRHAVVPACGEGSVGVVKTDAVVTGLSVRNAKFEVVHRPLHRLEEGFLADDPRGRRSREESPLVALGEFRRAVVAERTGDDVFLRKVIGDTAEERHQRLFLILVRRREVDARIDDGDIVGCRTGRVGREIPIPLTHQFVTHRRAHRMFVGERAIEGQMGRESVADGLGARLRRRTRLADEIRIAVDLAARIITAAVVVAVIVVLGGGHQPVDDPPFEVERTRNPIRSGLAVIERFVEGSQLRIGVAAAGDPADLVVETARRRSEHDSPSEGVEIVVHEFLAPLTRNIERRGSFEALGDLEAGVAVRGEHVVIAHGEDAAVVEVADRRGVTHLVVAAVNADVLLLPEGLAHPLILMIGIREDDDLAVVERIEHPLVTVGNRTAVFQIARRELVPIRGIARTHGDIGAVQPRFGGQRTGRFGVNIGNGRTHQCDLLACAEQIPLLGRRRKSHLHVEYDLRPLRRTALLRGDDDDAVRCAGAVNRSRCSVFENLHRLDVVGVDAGQIVPQGSVDDIDRIVAHVDRRSAANQETGRLARKRIVGRHPKTCDLSLQGVADGRDRSSVELVAVDLRDRRGQRLAGLRAVSDDDHLVDHFEVLHHRNVDDRALADLLLDALIAEIDELQHRILAVDAQRIVSGGIGGYALVCFGDHDRNARQRLARFVMDGSRNGDRRNGCGGGGYSRPSDAYQLAFEFEGDLLPCENPFEHRFQRFVGSVDRNLGVGVDVGRTGNERILVTFGNVFKNVGDRGIVHGERNPLLSARRLGRRTPDSTA